MENLCLMLIFSAEELIVLGKKEGGPGGITQSSPFGVFARWSPNWYRILNSYLPQWCYRSSKQEAPEVFFVVKGWIAH